MSTKAFLPDIFEQRVDIRRVDKLFARFFPLTDLPTDTSYGCFTDDPVSCAKDINGNFTTIVLASVTAPGWWWSYVVSFMLFMVKNVAIADSITLLAVKGGPFSDAEVNFIVEVLPLVGAVAVARGRGRKGSYRSALTWQWEISRGGGASTCKVVLVQYQEAADATDLAQMFRPSREHASAAVRRICWYI